MARLRQAPLYLFKAKTANGAGAPADVRDYRNITLTVYTTGSTTATIKFAVSNELKVPTFSSAASSTNVYDFVQITPVNSQLTADHLSGSTGIVLTGTDIVKMYTVDTSTLSNNFVWLCPIISGYSAGSITVELTASSDINH